MKYLQVKRQAKLAIAITLLISKAVSNNNANICQAGDNG